MDKIKNFINYKLEKQDTETLTIYFSLLILNVCIIVVFFFLVSLHAYFNHMNMVGLCIAMIASFFLVNILINFRRYEISFYLMLILMIIYIYLKIQILGSKTNVHILLLYFVVPQFTYNFNKKEKLFTNSLIVLVMFYAMFINMSEVSLETYEQSIFFAKFNIFALYVMLLVQLSSTTIIRKAIDKIRENELEFFKNKSQIDELTKLGNRYYAEKYFERVYNSIEKKSYTLALVDIDNFKNINDTYGHILGDEILKRVGQTAKTQFRKNDLVCRWGGEEFLIVLENIDLKKSEELLNRFRNNLKQTQMQYEDKEIKISVTAGVVEVENRDFTNAIKRADQKLYYGKNNGKDAVIV